GRGGAACRGLDRFRIAQVGVIRVDLADASERLQMTGEFGAADRDTDAVAALGERAHHVAAEEARAAVYRDQRLQREVGHGAVTRQVSQFRSSHALAAVSM